MNFLYFGIKYNSFYEVVVRIDGSVVEGSNVLTSQEKNGNTVLGSLMYFYFTGP